VHARRNAGPDVVDTPVPSRERGEDGLDDVADVHVVALVAAVAEERDRLATLPAPDENGDHATLEVLPLPCAVDVRQAERDRVDAGRPYELLGLCLEAAVVRWGVDRDRLVRAHRRLAVDRAAGRDVHEERRVVPARDERVDDVTTEESGAAGYEDTQDQADSIECGRRFVHRTGRRCIRGGRNWWRSRWTSSPWRGEMPQDTFVPASFPKRGFLEVPVGFCLPLWNGCSIISR